MKFKKLIQHTITITPLANESLLVTIGCAKFAYTDIGKLAHDLKEYLSDPKQAEKDYTAEQGKLYDQAQSQRAYSGMGAQVGFGGMSGTKSPLSGTY